MSLLGDELKEITNDTLKVDETFLFLTEKFKESAKKGFYHCKLEFDSSPFFSKDNFNYFLGKEFKKLKKWCDYNKISIFNYQDYIVFEW